MKNPEFLQLNLKRLMDSRGWSLKTFALESGVSYHTMFRAISKGVVPRGGNLQKIAKSLDVSVADLWIDPKDAPQPGTNLTPFEQALVDKLEGVESQLAKGRVIVGMSSPEDVDLTRRLQKTNSLKREKDPLKSGTVFQHGQSNIHSETLTEMIKGPQAFDILHLGNLLTARFLSAPEPVRALVVGHLFDKPEILSEYLPQSKRPGPKPSR